ncbi:MAG: hypothetical protein RI842_03925 [Schleiferiaceae bacterium]|nr:hypothetical protein [Schleiferiaceae bacterium]
MHKLFHIGWVLVLGVMLASGCRPDVKRPDWDVQALAPVFSTRIGINDLLADSTVSVGTGGQVKLVTRQKLANLMPGEVAAPLNDTFYNVANIQSLELSDQTITRRLSLGQLAAGAGLTGQLIIASHGSSQVIPPLNGIGPNSFPVDATQFFTSITLRDGWLVLRLENGLPVPLTNMQYQIINNGPGTATLIQNTIDTLAVSEVHYDSLRLNNNITISGQLQAELLNVDSPGSDGQSVPIDTSDAILTQVKVNQLDPVAATAVFPSQNLIEDTATSAVVAPSARLTKVHVSGGQLFLNAISTVEDKLEMDYVVPRGQRNGQTLQFTETLPPAPPGGTSSKTTTVPIQGYTIDMTGLPGASNVFNTFYAVFRGRVDSTGQLVSLSLEDSVRIRTGTSNLRADRGYGFMGYDTIPFAEKSWVEPIRELTGGQIRLDRVKVGLELDNYIGAPMDIRVDEIFAEKDASQRSLQWAQLGQAFTLPRAQEKQPGLRPQPGRLSLTLDSSNSNAERLIEIRPDSLYTDLTAYLNRNVASSDLSQFLYTDFGVETFLTLEVPLQASLNDLGFLDTNAFDYAELDPDGRLQSGALKLLTDNYFPLAFAPQLLLIDPNGTPLDTLASAEAIPPAQTDSTGRALIAQEGAVTFPITARQIPHLKETQQLVLLLRISSAQPPGEITLYSDNYLDVQLVGDLNISTAP